MHSLIVLPILASNLCLVVNAIQHDAGTAFRHMVVLRSLKMEYDRSPICSSSIVLDRVENQAQLLAVEPHRVGVALLVVHFLAEQSSDVHTKAPGLLRIASSIRRHVFLLVSKRILHVL